MRKHFNSEEIMLSEVESNRICIEIYNIVYFNALYNY